MASSDATPFPIKNQAYRVTFPIFDADGDLVTGAAGLDSEVSKDGGTFADCTNEATEIATASGMYYLDLSSTEMNADTVAIIVKTSTSGAKTTPIVLYPITNGLDIPVNATYLGGTAQTPRDIGASVLLSSGTGTGQLDFTSGVVKSNLVQIIATALTETVGGYLTAGFKKLFDVAVPVLTAASVNQTGDSYARLGAPAGASHAADVASVKTDTGTTIPAALTIIDDFLDTEIAQILGDTTTDIPAQISALNNLSAAQVNAEVVDALNVDTYAQPGQGTPAATTTMRLMLAYLYKWARNKRDNDGTTTKFYNDDASTVDHKQSTAESAGTVTVGEMATGP